MKNILKISFIVSMFLMSCNGGEPKVIIEPVQKNEAVMGDTVKRMAQTEKQPQQEMIPKINYTGKYELDVSRFHEFNIHHQIELAQVQDSVKGFYEIIYITKKGKLIANYKGLVRGKMLQTADNVNSGTSLWITLSEQKIDSANYKANKEGAYMIDKFLEGLLLTTRFSIKENTIENNYAGGEWDTWTRTE